MKQILAGDKDYILHAEVNFIKVPLFKELAMERMIPIIKRNDTLLSYLQDPEQLHLWNTNREFVFNVLNTLDPKFFPRSIEGD